MMPDMERAHLFVLGGVLAIIAIAGVTAYFFWQRAHHTDSQAVQVLANTATSTYTNLADEPISIADQPATVRVVTSWASWCPQCRTQLLDLSALAAETADRGVAVIAINRRETKEVATRYLETLPDLVPLTIVLDPVDRFFGSIGGYAMPETVFFNRSGDIVAHHRGVMSQSQLRAYLETALAAE